MSYILPTLRAARRPLRREIADWQRGALGLLALLAPRQLLTLNFGEHNPLSGPAMLQLSQEYSRRLKFSNQKHFLIKLQLQEQDDEPRLKEISAFLNKLLALIGKK